MPTKIFVNLPVKDLEKSKEFFNKLGYSFNPQFTDENAACLVISEDIYAMLVTTDFFKQFTKKEIADASRTTGSIIALSAESREEVNEMLQKALEAGGKESRDPEDQGWMYGRSFDDLDGHQWEFVWMDPDRIEEVS
jgi:predicted lactoylglutathione lyase